MKRLLFVLVFCLLLPAMAHAKTLKLAMDADPESLDPHVQLSGGMLQYSHMVFDPLVRFTKEGGFEPRLAEKWEVIDPLTTRFYLRKGVKFHSGSAFTAKDVAWTLDRLKKSDDFKGLFEPFTVAVAVDDHTVDLKTSKPYALVLAMATYLFPMDSAYYTGTDDQGKPKDAIVKTDHSFANKNASGTGPFKLIKREHGVVLELDRFADYWDKASKGNVSKIIFTPIPENAARVAALLSGGVDWIQPVPPQDYPRLEKEKNIQLVTMPGTRIITFQLNQKRKPELANPKVRLAIDYAIDSVTMVDKLLKGAATPAGQQGPEGMAGFDPTLTPRQDLEKAKALMKEAGYEKGFEATMICTNNRYVNDEKICEATVGMLAKIGIKVALTTYPKAQYWDNFDAQIADIQLIGWHPDTEDSANYSEYLLMCPNKETGYGQYNSGNYCNKALDELLMQAAVETDLAKRSELLRKVERIAYEDGAYVPLHWQNLSWAAKKGVHLEPIVNIMDFPYFGDLVID
ncbi:ABC transporter substrate-binding protein [Megalodesulfovibrio gigas]|uniref:Putative peptide ABC transporter substrate-binding protein n=1 Tax=Megalodesulfovibrio gigas (strain ATCC 19364 / DSM 1382 / NCIMB 9332 / VKM B-1759) TaxID=1121448 RepID=T2GAI3_MEGG1|nr:ABC transporter substrate-binding protein [Megalodesulfovibrio gigas]AGW13303.1 putative peptide ABC transporter substrate-binding protein [Megalodesulfovibrio gigas DSM 1382 = ATCC 19364]